MVDDQEENVTMNPTPAIITLDYDPETPTPIPTRKPSTWWSRYYPSIYFLSTTAEPSPVPFISPYPSPDPSPDPIAPPSSVPTTIPSPNPTASPSSTPTTSPSHSPTSSPTPVPTTPPSLFPSSHPSTIPTSIPSSQPTLVPTIQTAHASIPFFLGMSTCFIFFLLGSSFLWRVIYPRKTNSIKSAAVKREVGCSSGRCRSNKSVWEEENGEEDMEVKSFLPPSGIVNVVAVRFDNI